jgi:DNA-binding NarL/FixJ family response regulator
MQPSSANKILDKNDKLGGRIMNPKTMYGTVLLIDPLEMRRACLESVLSPWAQSLELDLTVLSPPDMQTLDPGEMVRLVVINLGGAGVNSNESYDMLLTAKNIYVAPVAILSERGDPEDAIAAAKLGFQAFLPATLSLEIVKQALTFVLGGGTYFPREALIAGASSGASRNVHARRKSATATGLTSRQHEVLERLRFGKSNKHIARELNMQEATVKVHVRQIMRKLGAANRTQAALLAQSDLNTTSVAEEGLLVVPAPQVINGVSSRLSFRP